MSLEFKDADLSKLRMLAEGNIAKLKESVIERLMAIGEHAVTIARDRGNYKDHTCNLRSSISYMIVYKGEIMSIGEQEAISGEYGDGTEGVRQSRELLQKIKSELPADKVVLVVCAGMNYAWYVENLHHKDVLVSSEIEAERLFRKLFMLD